MFPDKCTDPRNKELDKSSSDAFCALVKKMPDFAYTASKLVITKVQSTDEWESIQALSLLDSCMKTGGTAFQNEVGKFRFLNELIRLVSPKYLGPRTSPKVRDVTLKLIHSWTVTYREPKIREAYDMLKKQGVVIDEPPVQPTKSTPKKAIDQEFENKLKKLLSSRNPEDLEAANRMIQNKVLETDRRTSELDRVRTNIRLLSDLVENNQTGDVSQEDLQLMEDIHKECEKLRPVVFRLAGETHDDESLTDVLKISEELTQVQFSSFSAYSSSLFVRRCFRRQQCPVIIFTITLRVYLS